MHKKKGGTNNNHCGQRTLHQKIRSFFLNNAVQSVQKLLYHIKYCNKSISIKAEIGFMEKILIFHRARNLTFTLAPYKQLKHLKFLNFDVCFTNCKPSSIKWAQYHNCTPKIGREKVCMKKKPLFVKHPVHEVYNITKVQKCCLLLNERSNIFHIVQIQFLYKFCSPDLTNGLLKEKIFEVFLHL